MKTTTQIFNIVLIVLCSLKSLNAQLIQQLKPTANSAYMLLGVSPTNIERPTTPKEFATAFQNGIVNGKMAPNFALEVTPYDLIPAIRNGMTYHDKVIDEVLGEANFRRNVLNHLTLSVATSPSDTVALGTLKKGNGLAFGLKTILINGRPKAKTYISLLNLRNAFHEEQIYNDFINLIQIRPAGTILTEQYLTSIAANIYAAEQVTENAIVSTPQIQTIRIQRKREVIDDIVKDLNNEIDWVNDNDATKESKAITYLTNKATTLQNIQARLATVPNAKLAFAREGFIMDASLAYMAHFEKNEWDAWHYAKFSGWTTLSYRWNLDDEFQNTKILDAMLLLRYTANDMRVDSSGYFDAGLKFQYSYNKWTFSTEGIYRKLNKKPASVKTDYTYRFTVNLEYVLTTYVTLKASVGRNFDGNSAVFDKPEDKLFAMGGLNFTLLSGQ